MLTRRQVLERSAFAAAALVTPGLFAQEIATAPIAEGPFYPDKMPLDTDNDLLIINDALTPAVGEVTYLQGRVLTKASEPIRNAFVEIWQVDNNGSYIHTGDVEGRDRRDRNFQGYGRFLTNSNGEYFFRTIKPVTYTNNGLFRTPHIHFGISMGGKRVFTTQMLINGHPDNKRDYLFNLIKSPEAKKTILVDYNPVAGSRIGELAVNFDIVLGRTVEEMDDGTIRGLGKPLRTSF